MRDHLISRCYFVPTRHGRSDSLWSLYETSFPLFPNPNHWTLLKGNARLCRPHKVSNLPQIDRCYFDFTVLLSHSPRLAIKTAVLQIVETSPWHRVCILSTVQSKRGRHKAVTTTKQRLAKILKLDKSGRYMRWVNQAAYCRQGFRSDSNISQSRFLQSEIVLQFVVNRHIETTE